ncbi:Uncharacterised protein [Vibrio cholerae]|nr:Uncharacterised protein [Vibrio cholerae]CSC16800.1 Uncharacterised protein [Vibrio cholerae]
MQRHVISKISLYGFGDFLTNVQTHFNQEMIFIAEVTINRSGCHIRCFRHFMHREPLKALFCNQFFSRDKDLELFIAVHYFRHHISLQMNGCSL